MTNSASFGLDEDLARFRSRHVEFLDGQGSIGLPEDRTSHEGRESGHVISTASIVDLLLLLLRTDGGAISDPSPRTRRRAQKVVVIGFWEFPEERTEARR